MKPKKALPVYEDDEEVIDLSEEFGQHHRLKPEEITDSVAPVAKTKKKGKLAKVISRLKG